MSKLTKSERNRLIYEVLIIVVFDAASFGFLMWWGKIWALLLFIVLAMLLQEKLIQTLLDKVLGPAKR